MSTSSAQLIRRFVSLGVTLAIVLSAVSLSAAEVFVLRSGGRIEGKWLNREQSPRETFVIATPLGGEITLTNKQVERVIEPSADDLLYEKLRPTFPDTVAGHLELAEWCLERELINQRKSHLARVVELDPEHEEARTALGYRQVQGRWMTREEEMAARGFILYKGRYRTQQEIDLWEQQQKQELAEREWHGKLKRWYDWLGSSSKAATAVQQFRAIRDPYAVPALAKLLADETNPQRKLLLIETLAQIDSRAILAPLVSTSLNDRDPEIRLTCLDHLVRLRHPDAQKLYIAALKQKDNTKINRAAVALRELKNPEAIGPLIDALVTHHKFKIVTGGSPGQTSASFSPSGGGGGMNFGSKPPQIIERELRNEEVLSALVALSEGRNFSYDKKAWKHWHASQKNALDIDARRD